MEKSCKTINKKILGPIWSGKLPDRSYSVSDIQDCFEYLIKS